MGVPQEKGKQTRQEVDASEGGGASKQTNEQTSNYLLSLNVSLGERKGTDKRGRRRQGRRRGNQTYKRQPACCRKQTSIRLPFDANKRQSACCRRGERRKAKQKPTHKPSAKKQWQRRRPNKNTDHDDNNSSNIIYLFGVAAAPTRPHPLITRCRLTAPRRNCRRREVALPVALDPFTSNFSGQTTVN